MDWTFIGDAGNPCDEQGNGDPYDTYEIGTHEVTNAQYAEFLNAEAAAARGAN
ncbi:MAG: hypothetical protein ACRD2A_17690 [Vicinamibacterales bacterium]